MFHCWKSAGQLQAARQARRERARRKWSAEKRSRLLAPTIASSGGVVADEQPVDGQEEGEEEEPDTFASVEAPLVFESRFESGNLFSAARVGVREYELRLNTDYNTCGHTQWFYFSVHRPRGTCGVVGAAAGGEAAMGGECAPGSAFQDLRGVERDAGAGAGHERLGPEGGGGGQRAPGARFCAAGGKGAQGAQPGGESGREGGGEAAAAAEGQEGAARQEEESEGDEFEFNIVNMYKPDSLYNYGLLPLVYAERGGGGWLRKGSHVSYSKTSREDAERASATVESSAPAKVSYTLGFRLRIPQGETLYVAHCYPYTYSDLQHDLDELERDRARGKHLRRNPAFCHSRAGNTMDMLTVTDFGTPAASGQRPVVVITARVHPGSTCSSWRCSQPKTQNPKPQTLSLMS